MANTPPTLLFFILLFPHFTTAHSSGGVERWCRSMPHPDSCRSCLSHADPSPRLLTRSDFYKLSVKAALDNAIHAITRVTRLGNSCEGAAEKTAWLDCCKLFTTTAIQLNRTLSRSGGNSSDLADEQTWLSAALTNLDTCDRGFAELNANASFMKPVLRYNLSDLISNCLAVNNASFGAAAAWADVRRLMRVSGGADFVVAGDGSGDFRTVREAVEAAGDLRRRRKGRIVIHVKAGVYAEYLVIGNGVDDLTITGDGKGKTIITGQRSVALGFTTFSCPTLSKNSTNQLLL